MAINRLKIVFSILKEVSEGNIPTYQDYGIEKEDFFKILDAMQDDNLIKDIAFSRGGGNRIIIAFLENASITIKGMEYLNEHSMLMKTYKSLKEVRDWLPF